MKTPFLGCAYYPEDWDDNQLSYDIAMMKKAGIRCARIAEFAWRKMEPKPGQFEFAWLHRIIDALGENGIAVVLGTPTATPPVWLGVAHPDVFLHNPDGSHQTHGGRRHCCSNNPHYQEAAFRLVDAMGREFGHHPNVIGWQLDNEIHTWGVGCVCEYCQQAFHERLKNIYGTVENLNAQWNLNLFSQAYDSFDEVPPDGNAWHNPHLKYEWAASHYATDIRFIHKQADILKKYTDAPIGTDMMPTNLMSYEDMVEPLDIVEFNHYHVPENLYKVVFWFDFLRTLKKRPFWNTETAPSWSGATEINQCLKPEGFCRLNSWLPVALGGESNMYWLWRQHWAGHELLHGSVISPEGRPAHTFGEIQRTASEFDAAAAFLVGTKIKPEAAIHFTSKSCQLFQFQKLYADNIASICQDTPNIFANNRCEDQVKRIHKVMTYGGVRPDVIGAKHTTGGYKLIVSSCLMTLEDNNLAERMKHYVEDGGVWVVGPMTDIRNAIGAHYTDRAMGMLEDWLGVRLDYSVPTDGSLLKCAWTDGSAMPAPCWVELFTLLRGGETLAAVTAGHSALMDKTVIARFRVGKGTVILCGALLDDADMKKLLKIAYVEAGITPYQTIGSLNVIPRVGDAGEGLILCETGNAPASLTLNAPMTDLLTGETFTDTVPVEPYGVRVMKNAFSAEKC